MLAASLKGCVNCAEGSFCGKAVYVFDMSYINPQCGFELLCTYVFIIPTYIYVNDYRVFYNINELKNTIV